MSRVGFIDFGDSGREGGNKTRQREEERERPEAIA
jgi:hypothetical protein